MLELYLDESVSYFGPDPDRRALLVIAGYVAEAEEWAAFSKAWTQTLQTYQLSHFHAKEIRSRDARLFRHLSLDERRELLSGLCSLISQHVLLGVAGYMRPYDYEGATTQEVRSRMGSTYGALTYLLLMKLSGVLLNPSGTPDRVNIFLEAGHRNSREAVGQIAHYKASTEPVRESIDGVTDIIDLNPLRTSFMRIGDYGLLRKKEAPPLQAADLLAYLIGLSAHICEPAPVYDGVLDTLLQTRPHVLSPWGPQAVAEFVNAMPAAEAQAAANRADLYRLKRRLRSFGLKVREYPWGITMDGRHLSEDEWQNYLKNRMTLLDT
jgi:hypothetical protein